MNEFTHTGQIVFDGGLQRNAVLKLGDKHWLDVDGHRWRFKDGSLAGNPLGTYPRLLTHTIHRRDPALKKAKRMTHQCRVKNYKGKDRTQGPGEFRELRLTKLFWIDANGNKFRLDGDGVGKHYERLNLSSLAEMPLIDGVRSPVKRTHGSLEEIPQVIPEPTETTK